MPTLPTVTPSSLGSASPSATRATFRMMGIVEGFYGPPWSWRDRVDVLQWSAARGLTDYMYAPKDDPKHRRAWREPYDAEEVVGFRSLVDQAGVRIGFAISPGLSIDEASSSDRGALAAKVDQIVDLGVTHVGLFLDDLPPDPSRTPAEQGAAHAGLATWLRDHLESRASLSVCPTEYIGTQPSPYLTAFARGLPADVPVGWTGASVVNDEITADEARARADALGGRRPLLWDNVPVNDAVMSDRLFMGPLRGRSTELREMCSGYMANPMMQPRASMLPLASIAAWCTGGDPSAAWDAAATELGWRAFAEACDGAVPQQLVRALIEEGDGPGWVGAADDLESWLNAAASCTAPGLESEGAPWLAQVHAEAALAQRALTLVRATRPRVEISSDGSARATVPDAARVLRHAFAVASEWPVVRRAFASVFGPRLGVRPALAQHSSGAWLWRADAIEEDTNATDDLVRLALDSAARIDAGTPLVAFVDGVEMARGPEVTFPAASGCVVLARCGDVVTRVRVP